MHKILIYIFVCVCVCVCVLRPNEGYGLHILEVSRSHTTTHHSRKDSSGPVISSLQRPLPDNTQHSQQTNIHALGGIRTHDLSRRAAAGLRLRPHGHWDRQYSTIINIITVIVISCISFTLLCCPCNWLFVYPS